MGEAGSGLGYDVESRCRQVKEVHGANIDTLARSERQVAGVRRAVKRDPRK